MKPFAVSPSAGDLGAAYELLVSSDLLRRGYHVFRAVSPHASCDLVAIDRSGKTYRVECKSAYYGSDGTIRGGVGRKPEYDILARVTASDSVVHYFDPSLNEMVLQEGK